MSGISAPLQASLPALSVAGPLAGMAFGALAFREAPAHGPLAVAGEVAGMAVIIVSVALLGRLSAAPGRRRRGGARGAAVPPQDAGPGAPLFPAPAVRR